MTGLISMTERMRLVSVGYKLHHAIVDWGKHHGVMAYMVKPDEGQVYFEIFDPRTKEISHTFPARITQAIKRCAREVDEYVAWDRSFDSPRPGAGPFGRSARPAPNGRNPAICECNARCEVGQSHKISSIDTPGEARQGADEECAGGFPRK